MWPFKRKMTVDYLASVVAEAIEEDVDTYVKAINAHVAENITEDEIDVLIPELWVIELSIVDLVVAILSNSRRERLGALGDLVPMIVVAYSPLEKDKYIERSQSYAGKVATSTPDKIAIYLAEEFVSYSGIIYKNERIDVNRKALTWAIGAVASGSISALGSLISDTLKNYRVI